MRLLAHPPLGWLQLLACIGPLLAAPSAVDGQGTDASIAGVVRTNDGAALPGAAITVRNDATGYIVHRVSGEDGQFFVPQLPLGGPYTVTVEHVGHQTARRTGIELHLGDRVPVDFRLDVEAVALEAIEVAADRTNARIDRFGASTPISSREIARVPATGRNFTDLAVLSPLAGDDALRIAGDKNVSTGIEVDGVSARNNIQGRVAGLAPYVLSLEAIREFEVATNVYDVTKGRQGGGTVSAVTKAGTNEWHGSFFMYHRNDGLAGADYTGRDPNEFRVYQWGGSLSGPLVRDRAHFFVAFDRQDESTPYRILDVQNDADAVANGIHGDSIARLLSILEDKYGLSSSQVGVFTRKPVSTTAFGRVDWQLDPRHRLTVRANLVDFFNESADGNDFTLNEAWADDNSLTFSTLASLSSTLGTNVQNELKLSFNRSTTMAEPLTAAPKGIVTISSELPNGNTTSTNVTFGGNDSGFNESTWQNNFQLVNTTHINWRGHRIKFGIDQLYTDISLTQFIGRWGGTFEFNSLADLEAMRPSQFTRKVPVPFDVEPNADVKVWNGGVFAQTEWEPAPRLTAMVGLRYDVASFLNGADYNPEVEQLLGLRTDHNPTDWTKVQPRVHLTWDIAGDGRQVVRAGGGRFSAQTLYLNQANHALNPGNRAYGATLLGDDVPSPDFVQYRADPSTSPVPDPQIGAPEVNVVSRDFKMPTTWKANISYQRLVGNWLSLGANFLISNTYDNYHYFDRNLVDESYFTIEGGRGVFVPPDQIEADGNKNPTSDATKTPELGRVRELLAIGEARQRALVLEAGLSLPREGSLNFSYTWNRSRDNSSYECCAPNTSMNTAVAGDPRDLDGAWGSSDFDFRHKIVGFGSLPKLWGFQLSGRYIARSGTPVSLVVDGDVNGDFNGSNDLAFVFDPDDPATPPDIAESMRNVLNNPDNLLRDHIADNLGRIAERNGGRAPWRHNIDVRLTREFELRPGQRTELLVDVFNFANLLNDEWGGYENIGNKQELLYIEGFDPVAQRYVYSVNENIGVVEQKSGPGYQIQIGLRHSF